jgi:hypothetical protein
MRSPSGAANRRNPRAAVAKRRRTTIVRGMNAAIPPPEVAELKMLTRIVTNAAMTNPKNRNAPMSIAPKRRMNVPRMRGHCPRGGG